MVEVLVVVAVFVTLSSIIVVDYRNNGRKQRLQGIADEMASRIKQAQGLAYASTRQNICSTDKNVCGAGSACDPSTTNCSLAYVFRYGIRFDTDGTQKKYMIGADYDSTRYGQFDVKEAIANGIVTLPSGVKITSVTPAQVAGMYDLDYIYDSSNYWPFLSCAANCLTTIVLTDTGVTPNITKTVTVQKQTGIVSVL